jgi:hypothetical protein
VGMIGTLYGRLSVTLARDIGTEADRHERARSLLFLADTPRCPPWQAKLGAILSALSGVSFFCGYSFTDI